MIAAACRMKLVRPEDRLILFLSWVQLPGDRDWAGEQQRALHCLSKRRPLSTGVWGCADHVGRCGACWQVLGAISIAPSDTPKC